MVACSDQLSQDAPDSALRLMVILSDGEDNSSHLNRETTLLALVKAGVKIYMIGRGESAKRPRRAEAVRGSDWRKELFFREGTGSRKNHVGY